MCTAGIRPSWFARCHDNIGSSDEIKAVRRRIASARWCHNAPHSVWRWCVSLMHSALPRIIVSLHTTVRSRVAPRFCADVAVCAVSSALSVPLCHRARAAPQRTARITPHAPRRLSTVRSVAGPTKLFRHPRNPRHRHHHHRRRRRCSVVISKTNPCVLLALISVSFGVRHWLVSTVGSQPCDSWQQSVRRHLALRFVSGTALDPMLALAVVAANWLVTCVC